MAGKSSPRYANQALDSAGYPQQVPYQGSKDCTGGVSYAVTVLQRHLGLKADGIFGTGTKAKLVEWQKAHGLAADGICGMATWSSF